MDVIKLIRGVKARQPLWDRKHAYYHDRSVTMGLWDDVASILGADPDSVRLKWKGLRDTFRGELKKLHKGAATDRVKTSTNWEYFKEMLFVKDQIYSTKHLKDNNKPISLFAALDDSNSCSGEPPAKMCKVETEYNTEEIEDKQRLNNSTDHESHDTTNHHYYPTSMEDDDDYNFLMSVLPQLRCLPTTRNLYIRLKIQELLYNEIIALQSIN